MCGWQAFHVGYALRFVVGVAISLAVFELLHQPGWGIAEVERNRLGHFLGRGLSGFHIRYEDRVALRSVRQVDRGLRQRGVSLGHPDEMDGVLGRHRDAERLGIGVPNVL